MRQAVLFHLRDARVPTFRAADPCGAGADHQLVEACAGVDAEPLPDQAAERKPAEMRAFELQCIHQRQHIPAQISQRIGRWRRAGTSMSAAVVPQHTEMHRQRLSLQIPHRQIGAQRVAEHQPRAVLAVNAVMPPTLHARRNGRWTGPRNPAGAHRRPEHNQAAHASGPCVQLAHRSGNARWRVNDSCVDAVAPQRPSRPGEKWWAQQDSNLQPKDYESSALTIEL